MYFTQVHEDAIVKYCSTDDMRVKEELYMSLIRPAFSQPIALRVNELISGIKSDIAIKIFGEDIDILLDKAGDIASVISSIDGVRDVAIEQVSGFSPEYLSPSIPMTKPEVSISRKATNTKSKLLSMV